MTTPLVILAGDSPWTWALANALRRRFGEVPIILEDKPSTVALLRNRLRRLGFFPVAGQIGFGVMAKTLRYRYREREKEMLLRHGLDPTPAQSGLRRVRSANDESTADVLRALAPKVVVVSQTRILARRMLASSPARFINIHTGITPQYRGLHGAYWALANGDAENCGVTVHLVDAGVDTGPIIAQARITPSPADSYFTYHWLQLAAALPLVIRAIEDSLADRLLTMEPRRGAASGQYYHPTLWGYVWTGLRRGVW